MNTSDGILFLLLLVAIVFLQVYLSKQESKWLGLILPIVAFAVSLLAVMGVLIMPGALATLIFIFVVFNIPTAILFAIYKIIRNSHNQSHNIDGV